MKLWILQPDCETSPYPLSASNVYAHRAKDQPKFHYRKSKTLEDECKKHLVEIKDTETKLFPILNQEQNMLQDSKAELEEMTEIIWFDILQNMDLRLLH